MVFSTFPGGWPGLGLLLLRITVAVATVLQFGLYFSSPADSTIWNWVIGLVGVAVGTSLLIGFLTPIAGIILVLGRIGIALSWIPAPATNLFASGMAGIELLVMAITIVMVGPGAISLDARLFGRREIIIPDTSRWSKPDESS
jgi:uncharacterized membrane protein YphA (DoxX/SURF4 family)